MKKIFLSLVLAGITLAAFCQKTETRAVSSFTGIDASSSFNITVTKGEKESLTIEADDDVMQYVRSEVKQGILRLYLDNNRGKIKNVKTLKASIVMKNLDLVRLSGACKLASDDLFVSDNFNIDCSGASGLNLNIKTNALDVDLSGACNIGLKADVADNAKFDASGASKMQVELTAATVRFSVSGSSKIDLKGSATKFDIGTSGASTIKAADFIATSVTVRSSGASNISVHATESLNVNSSGASTITYKGSPSIEMSGSGSSKIKKI